MSKRNGRIVTPVPGQFSAGTKHQLVRALTEQGEQLRVLKQHANLLAKILVAITHEPEAFHYQDGTVAIDRAAIDRVRKGTQLFVLDKQHPDWVALTTTPPDDQRIVRPA